MSDIVDRLTVALDGDLPGDPLHHGCRHHNFNGACTLCRQSDRIALATDALTEIRTLRGAMKADDARLLAATDKVGMTPAGCDAADEMADEILRLRAILPDLIERMEKAEAALKSAAGSPDSDEAWRLWGKAQGVDLALSYAREYLR